MIVSQKEPVTTLAPAFAAARRFATLPASGEAVQSPRNHDKSLSRTNNENQFKCLYCESSAEPETFLKDCPDCYLRKPFKTDFFRCCGCGAVQAWPIPSDVSLFYDSYPVHKRKSVLHQFMRKVVMAPAYFDTRLLRQGSTLLDYGCGDGWFLEECKQRKLSLVGFERSCTLSEDLSKRLGIPIYCDPGRLISDFEGKVDVLTMHFVMEHLTDLASTFGHVQRLLKPGGTFFFTIPNINSWEARLFGKNWHGLDAPRHISFANPDCIKTLARKYGMKCTEVRSIPFPNGFAGSVPVVLTGRFNFLLYLCALPLGLALSRLAPSGFSAYSLKKKVQSTSGSAAATTHNPSNA